MRKMSFKVGDIVQARYAFIISNTDDTDEESDEGDIFFVLECEPQEGFNAGEYKLIRQKSLKVSSWSVSGMENNFSEV